MKKNMLFSFAVVILCLSLIAPSVAPSTNASTTNEDFVSKRQRPKPKPNNKKPTVIKKKTDKETSKQNAQDNIPTKIVWPN